ncbi:putative phosphate acyltransferase [Chlamydia trachomatis]|nr:putative phosphate acyltransferase [Chlamydia trachomatis]
MKARLNPDTYGGAPLLGVEGVCMIGHGSSSKDAICNGILMCAQATRGKLVESIRHSIGAE